MCRQNLADMIQLMIIQSIHNTWLIAMITGDYHPEGGWKYLTDQTGDLTLGQWEGSAGGQKGLEMGLQQQFHEHVGLMVNVEHVVI